MKQAFWAYAVVAFGVVIVIIMLFIQRMTITTEENYYLEKEILESSMIDAVDYGTYRTTGKIVMSEQKFVEVFIRRFAESVTNNKTYQLNFYDIKEEPPKPVYSRPIRITRQDITELKIVTSLKDEFIKIVRESEESPEDRDEIIRIGLNALGGETK